MEVNIEEQLLRKAHEVNLPAGTVQTIVQQVSPCQFDFLLQKLERDYQNISILNLVSVTPVLQIAMVK